MAYKTILLLLTTYTSRYIEQKLSEIKDRKNKNAFLDSIMNATTAVLLNEANGHKTTLFQGNKGPISSTWEQTKLMAFELNDNGIDVAFLSELLSDVCADSLIKMGNDYRIADFKYCITTKANTLSKDLEHGFEQASCIVLKLVNMDLGLFKDAIDYLLRNEIHYGNIILINKYGKTCIITHKDIKSGGYVRKTKGFL